jgi:hypothetical protein
MGAFPEHQNFRFGIMKYEMFIVCSGTSNFGLSEILMVFVLNFGATATDVRGLGVLGKCSSTYRSDFKSSVDNSEC